ncbi:hypothetical protein SVI_3157 [Shewanella violacea DSS12]|uniref:Uncharacterized protein n=1 Tax=Shewanella violacea (strain JCM 10179 / CIP 106290 / LMG 19151 / DSS12) TaxID=637905 RepID=D4ZAT3_SHEVD|nr:hypothetical protein SVI_3157 [Shewanella violacea DSS12]
MHTQATELSETVALFLAVKFYQSKPLYSILLAIEPDFLSLRARLIRINTD